MRVLHLVKTSVGATWVLRQVRELVQLGLEVHVALPADGPLIPAYKAAGVHVHYLQTDLPVRQPWKLASSVNLLRALVSKVNPDIIHSHFVGTTLMMRLALGRRSPIPRVFQVPGPLHLEHHLFREAEIRMAGLSDYWIGSCEWTCRRYQRSGIAADRVFLSYYGTDVNGFVPRPKGKLRHELCLTSETKIVGMVAYMYAPKRYLGQTSGLKGHEDLIDALAICMKSDPTLVGVFIGGAWNGATTYEERVREYARQRLGKRAFFLGTRDDVADLYADFDVVVHPSHSENVGGAAESLLLAVPTIATNVGGFPDLVKPGKTGWLVPPKNPPALAVAITEALSNRSYAQQLAREGQVLARSLFDVKRTSREVVQIYKNVLYN